MDLKFMVVFSQQGATHLNRLSLPIISPMRVRSATELALITGNVGVPSVAQ